jgi:hypothetical protein
MKKVKKPVGYLIFGCIFLFGVLINIATDEGNRWAAVLWSVLSILMFFVAYKKNNKYRQQIAKESIILNKLKGVYRSVIDGSEIHQADSIILELADSENIPEPQIKNIAQKVVKTLIDESVHKETERGSLSPLGYDNILNTAKKAEF